METANREVLAVTRALEGACADVFSFAVVCTGGMQALADTLLQEILLLSLERGWFTENLQGNYSHEEHRTALFREVWLAANERQAVPAIGIDVPIGHEQMAFYQLPRLARAVLYLRTKRKLSYEMIGSIVGIAAGAARTEVEKSRSILLGRAPKEFSEEAF